MNLFIRQAELSDPLILNLIHELDNYQSELYPEESNHLDSPEELVESDAYFVAGFVDGRPVGIGAIKVFEAKGYAEIKRVYVNPAKRGLGISKQIMQVLEDHARDRGCCSLMLETGIHQPEAIGLYERLGYQFRKCFGDYPADDPLSVFMEKNLV